MERVLPPSRGQTNLGNIGVCCKMICVIDKWSVNLSSSAHCHICAKVSTLGVTLENSIVTTQRTLRNIQAMPNFRETSIFIFWVSGYNNPTKFNEGNLVLADVSSNCVLVSTWNHLKGHSCTISCHISSHWLFASVRIIPHTVCLLSPPPGWTSILMLDCMALSGLNCISRNPISLPCTTKLCWMFRVICRTSANYCHLAPSESQPCKSYLAIVET